MIVKFDRYVVIITLGTTNSDIWRFGVAKRAAAPYFTLWISLLKYNHLVINYGSHIEDITRRSVYKFGSSVQQCEKLTPNWLKVRNPKDISYQTLVKEYWNWLLDVEKVVDDPIKKLANRGVVFFMRSIYGYRNQWTTDPDTSLPTVNRKNVVTINRMGANNQKRLDFPANKAIFLPVIDSCESDFDKDTAGIPLTPRMMNKILEEENDDVERKVRNGTIRSTIKRLQQGKDSTPYDIVDDLTRFRIGVPDGREGTSTFELKVPQDSRLAQELELEFPQGKTVNARAQGIYLIFEITQPGLYQIRSSAEGLRGYNSDMNYRINII